MSVYLPEYTHIFDPFASPLILSLFFSILRLYVLNPVILESSTTGYLLKREINRVENLHHGFLQGNRLPSTQAIQIHQDFTRIPRITRVLPSQNHSFPSTILRIIKEAPPSLLPREEPWPWQHSQVQEIGLPQRSNRDDVSNQHVQAQLLNSCQRFMIQSGFKTLRN